MWPFFWDTRTCTPSDPGSDPTHQSPCCCQAIGDSKDARRSLSSSAHHPEAMHLSGHPDMTLQGPSCCCAPCALWGPSATLIASACIRARASPATA